jgi:adenylate kinase
VYNKQTAPLVEYYSKMGNLHVIDGMAAIAAVTLAMAAVLAQVRA